MPNSDYFHHNIERLSHEVLESNLLTPEAFLRQMVDELAGFSPVYAAGALQLMEDRASLSYLHWSGGQAGANGLEIVLDEHAESLKRALRDQTILTLRSSVTGTNEPLFFTALPVGNIGDRQVCLALLSERALTDSEQSHVLLLGRLVGQCAHSAHVHQTMLEEERERAVNLIALIAHELRTPLTGLRGNVQLALMASQSGKLERIPARLETAISSVDAMTALVQSLLDVSRLERGTYHLEPTLSDLRDTVSTTVQAIDAAIDHDRHRVRLDNARSMLVNHDRQAFGKVIENLLRAIVRYSPDGSDIDISIDSAADKVSIEFRYRGNAFSIPDRKALLAPLYGETDRSEDRQSTALPLDLAFCRGVVVSHGGEIEITGPTELGDQLLTIRVPAS